MYKNKQKSNKLVIGGYYLLHDIYKFRALYLDGKEVNILDEPSALLKGAEQVNGTCIGYYGGPARKEDKHRFVILKLLIGSQYRFTNSYGGDSLILATSKIGRYLGCDSDVTPNDIVKRDGFCNRCKYKDCCISKLSFMFTKPCKEYVEV